MSITLIASYLHCFLPARLTYGWVLESSHSRPVLSFQFPLKKNSRISTISYFIQTSLPHLYEPLLQPNIILWACHPLQWRTPPLPPSPCFSFSSNVVVDTVLIKTVVICKSIKNESLRSDFLSVLSVTHHSVCSALLTCIYWLWLCKAISHLFPLCPFSAFRVQASSR